jgi:hypothetical protein
VRLRVSDLRAEWELQRKAFVAAVAAGQHRIANTYDGTGSGLEPPINSYDFATETRAFVKTIADADGRPPQFPHDVLVLAVQGEGLAFQGAGAQVRLPVPADGRVEATLVATSALPALQLRQLTITADYYPDADQPAHKRLQADAVVIVHERLRGLILNALAGVIGRGEGLTARGSELLMGMVPLAGDAVGLLGEAINALDPTTEVSTLNASLAVVGMATEFTQVTGPAGPIDPGSHRSLSHRSLVPSIPSIP